MKLDPPQFGRAAVLQPGQGSQLADLVPCASTVVDISFLYSICTYHLVSDIIIYVCRNTVFSGYKLPDTFNDALIETFVKL